ncbi:heparinase II/III family protein [Paenibacillus sp. MWE-103]|uniref:Heparinase II/III family protein n=1 Tax=Paenibacillus artemisiicola TaxID=1172618 RepID=A0ABS3WEY1_9BACL|nr:heparinase II/III family protein [Paenibacillus artemisiicola]MBO7746884.1 heparinase II/III family protein [Paenibacillus artemisiicola]
MLAERYANEDLGKLLLPKDRYKPFPAIGDRESWEALPETLKSFWLRKGERRLEEGWAPLPAAAYMAYGRTGDRERYDRASWERRHALAELVVAECIENRGRFADEIVNGIWSICEETFWGIPAHGYMMKRQELLPDVSDPVIELFAAETAALLAWTLYLLRPVLDETSRMIGERIELEVGKRILDPYLERDDFWWMGFHGERMLNNWNPWCHSNCLAAVLLLEADPARRETAVAKALRSLDRYLERLHPDGGCEEGPKYWLYAAGALFDCLELLHGASEGAIDGCEEPLIRRMGAFLYKVFIDEAYYVNAADSPPRVAIPAELVYRYGRRTGDARLAELGARAQWMRGAEATRPEFANLFRLLPAILHYAEVERYSGDSPYVRDAWLDGIQWMAAREREGSSAGLYLAAKGGHNDESHNHNDIGHFIVYCDGSPMLVDPGVLTYTSKSFFAERYDQWAVRSAYHNVPLANGVQQMNGRPYRAGDVRCERDDEAASLAMELAGAYPDAAGIVGWRRTCTLVRGGSPYVEIRDAYRLRQPSAGVALHLMTPRLPRGEGGGSFVLEDERGNRIRIAYDGDRYAGEAERVPLEDPVMREAWGEQLYRIRLTLRAPAETGESVIRISRC